MIAGGSVEPALCYRSRGKGPGRRPREGHPVEQRRNLYKGSGWALWRTAADNRVVCGHGRLHRDLRAAGRGGYVRLIQAIYELMAAAVKEQGGSVKDFTGDGIMALFGVPESMEDGPLRACRAGLLDSRTAHSRRSRDRGQARRPTQMRIGVNSGLAVVTQIRGESGRETALGDTMNLASRLPDARRGGNRVFQRGDTAPRARLVETTFAGDHPIKGKAEPQRVYRLEAIRHGATRFDAAVGAGPYAYVGREHELDALERGLARSPHGMRVIDVVAEPGMGKSRLLHEFRKRIGRGAGLRPNRKLFVRRQANALPAFYRGRSRFLPGPTG